MTGTRIAAIGECMIELSHRDDCTLGLAFGGDTLNTAIYLRRASGGKLAVDYLTALGDDPYSEAMLAAWQAEGLGTSGVARLAGKLPGLYLIRTDPAGERRFFYYRSAAAARELFAHAATLPLLDRLREYGLIYLSAITLSILSEPARERLIVGLADARKHGTRIVFDSNYRPAGWPDPSAARTLFARVAQHVDIALPTFEDERALAGDADPGATASRYRASGVREVAVKMGAAGCLVDGEGASETVPVGTSIAPVDTTAAGDAFNAGYLVARLAGRAPRDAAMAGHRVAGAVIQHRGAIIPRAATPIVSDDA